MRIGDAIGERQGTVSREEIEAIHEQLGVKLNDSSLLAQVMETGEMLMSRGFMAAAKAHAVTMLHNPDLIRGKRRT